MSWRGYFDQEPEPYPEDIGDDDYRPPPEEWSVEVFQPQYRPPPRDNRRRAKLFARAEKTLLAAALVAGCLAYSATPLYARNGRRIGLRIGVAGNFDLEWTPRGGYRTVECDEIPF